MRTLSQVVQAWNVTPDGRPFATSSSLLLPVRSGGRAAMLKLARISEEVRAGRVLASWQGAGIVPVWRHAGPAVLMARAATGDDLVLASRSGRDDEALEILAGVARSLHVTKPPDTNDLVPLARWFASLATVAHQRGGAWRRGWQLASELLASQPAIACLHGDLHHGNVLRFPDGAWRAIDPKGLVGDPTFDLVAALLNPDRSAPHGDPSYLTARAERLAGAAAVDRARLLAWTEAFAVLSAAWAVQEGSDPTADLRWAGLVRRARVGA